MFSGSFYPPKKHSLVRNRETGEKYIKTVLKKGKKPVASSSGNNNASAATNTVQQSSKQNSLMLAAAQQSNATAESNRKGTIHKRELSMTSPSGNMRYTESSESYNNNTKWQGSSNDFFKFG